jgi:hypothetical protein
MERLGAGNWKLFTFVLYMLFVQKGNCNELGQRTGTG